MEEWVTKWAQYSGVGSRLTTFLSSPEGEKLVATFRVNGLDPEVIPFLLWSFVWPVERLRTAPSRSRILDVAQQLRRAARGLLDLEQEDCGIRDTARLREELLQQAERMTLANLPVGLVGNVEFGSGRELRGKKDVAKRTVVLFLLGYLRELGHIESGMWPLITQFLIAAKMEAPSKKPKNVASWWASCLKREAAEETSVKEHQAGLILLFEDTRKRVHSTSTVRK